MIKLFRKYLCIFIAMAILFFCGVSPGLAETGMQPGSLEIQAKTSLDLTDREEPIGIVWSRVFIHFAVIFGFVLLLVAGFVSWNKALKKQVNRKILELRQELEDRKKAEEALLESEKRFKSIFNASNDAIFIHDLETGAILDVNSKMCEMFGLSRKEALESNVGAISSGIPPYTQEEALSWIQKAVAGKPQIFEWHAKDRAGNLFWVEINMGRAAIGPIDRVIVSARDITQHKSAEAALQKVLKKREELEFIINKSPAIVFLWRAAEDWPVEYVSENVRQLGYTPEDFMDGHVLFSDVIHKEDFERVGKEVAAYSESGVDEFRQEYRMKTRAGDVIWTDDTTWIRRDQDGNITHYQGIVLNVTHRKKMEQELQRTNEELQAMAIDNAKLYAESQEQTVTLEDNVYDRTLELDKSRRALLNLVEDLNCANEKLKELDRLKSMFIASMSHELRTPLNSIIGFSGLILGNMVGPISDEQKDMLTRVSSAGKHLLALITDVIDIAKIESGKVLPYPEEFELVGVVKEAVGQLEALAIEKGLVIQQQLPEESIVMNTDQRRLLQCLLNFLSNAVKFSEKGIITIAVEKTSLPGAGQGKALPEAWVKISVADTGIGIKEEDMTRLFGSFVRLDNQVKTITPGTGLGLYLTRKLAREVLGGEVGAESEEGKGSMFWIKIPLALEPVN